MTNDTVKQVLAKIVEIDAEAEAKLAEHQEYVQTEDIRVKHELKELELSLMKDMRSRAKTEYNEKMKAANAEKAAILESSSDYTKRVTDYYNAHKDDIVDDLFKTIFGEA